VHHTLLGDELFQHLFYFHPNTQYTEGSGAGKTIAKDIDNNVIELDESKINAEIIRLQAEYDAQEYARNRASAFPSIGDQLDMQYHDQIDGTTTWEDAIAKVKSDNPKE